MPFLPLDSEGSKLFKGDNGVTSTLFFRPGGLVRAAQTEIFVVDWAIRNMESTIPSSEVLLNKLLNLKPVPTHITAASWLFVLHGLRVHAYLR